MQYEGIATNDEHKTCMDSILDRCIMYMVGQDKKLGENLGGDAEFAAKAPSSSQAPCRKLGATWGHCTSLGRAPTPRMRMLEQPLALMVGGSLRRDERLRARLL